VSICTSSKKRQAKEKGLSRWLDFNQIDHIDLTLVKHEQKLST
jgi:hypothetical protein